MSNQAYKPLQKVTQPDGRRRSNKIVEDLPSGVTSPGEPGEVEWSLQRHSGGGMDLHINNRLQLTMATPLASFR